MTKRVKWKEWLQYVQDNLKYGNMQEIANHIGCKISTLRNQVFRWKSLGYDMIDSRKAPEGTVNITTINGIRYERTKVNGKWKLGKRIDPYKPPTTTGMKLSEEHKRKLQEGNRKHIKENRSKKETKRPQVIVLPTRVVDESKMKTVRVNRSTCIAVPKHISDQEAIARYNSKYKN